MLTSGTLRHPECEVRVQWCAAVGPDQTALDDTSWWVPRLCPLHCLPMACGEDGALDCASVYRCANQVFAVGDVVEIPGQWVVIASLVVCAGWSFVRGTTWHLVSAPKVDQTKTDWSQVAATVRHASRIACDWSLICVASNRSRGAGGLDVQIMCPSVLRGLINGSMSEDLTEPSLSRSLVCSLPALVCVI